MEIYILYSVVAISLIFALLFLLSMPYGVLGLKLWFAKMRWKKDTGLLLLFNKAGVISKIVPINLQGDKYTLKGKGGQEQRDYTYSRDQIMKGTFLGFPYIMMDADDTKTTVGMYYQQSHPETHEPLFYDEQKTVPVLSPIKDSVSLSPSYFQALVGDHTLTMALKDFLAKNKQIIMIAGVGVIAAGAAAFFAFDIISTHVPEILKQIAAANDKLTQILELLQQVTA